MATTKRRTQNRRRRPRVPPQPPRNNQPQPLPPQLDLHNRQIRILRLLPAPNRTDPIQCALYTAYLDDDPSYEALSYAWGDATVTRQIFVNKSRVNVTENLAAALRNLRRRFHDRCLWVDALCINQRDDAEKSHQVNLMKDIYARAPNTILWLGDYLDGSSSLPPHTMGTSPVRRCPSAAMSRREVATAFRFLRRLARDEDGACDVPLTRRLAAQPPGPECFEAMKSLLALPWWSRIWTVQEAVLPKRPTVMCGTMQIPLEIVLKASSNSERHRFKCGRCRQPGLGVLWDTIHPIQFVRLTGDVTPELFADALIMFRYRKASDPRDRVFALLGLGATITADYSLSCKEVFINSARQQIVQSGHLIFLKRIAERNRSPDLPSWVPDWCAEPDGYVSQSTAWSHVYKFYNAASGKRAIIGHSDSESVLALQGWVTDKVSMVSDYVTWDNEDRFTVADQWKDMMMKSQNCCPYQEGYEEAFWRLTVCDVFIAEDDKRPGFYYRRAVAEDEAESKRTWGANASREMIAPFAQGKQFLSCQGASQAT